MNCTFKNKCTLDILYRSRKMCLDLFWEIQGSFCLCTSHCQIKLNFSSSFQVFVPVCLFSNTLSVAGFSASISPFLLTLRWVVLLFLQTPIRKSQPPKFQIFSAFFKLTLLIGELIWLFYERLSNTTYGVKINCLHFHWRSLIWTLPDPNM